MLLAIISRKLKTRSNVSNYITNVRCLSCADCTFNFIRENIRRDKKAKSEKIHVTGQSISNHSVMKPIVLEYHEKMFICPICHPY